MTQTSKHRQAVKRSALKITGDKLAELERLYRALRTLSAGNRMLLRSSDELQLLKGMCDVVVTQGGYRCASVWYASNDEGQPLVNQAYSLGLPHEKYEVAFFESLRLSWASPEQGGATAIAVLTGTPCIGRNLLSDPDHRAWREDAIRLGYGSLDRNTGGGIQPSGLTHAARFLLGGEYPVPLTHDTKVALFYPMGTFHGVPTNCPGP